MLRQTFGVPVGFSDHTAGFDVTIAAVALGASIIEKHITTDRALSGPDHAASLEPDELKAMTAAIRRVERALIRREKGPSSSELSTASVARKSLHFSRDLAAGACLGMCDLVAMRPGTGILPSAIGEFEGRCLVRSVAAGEMLKGDMLR